MSGLIKFLVKYGSKIITVVKGASGVIAKYGTKAIKWIKNNVHTILDIIAALPTIQDAIDWLIAKLNQLFG